MTYFPNFGKIEYEGQGSKNPFAYKFYDPDRIIDGKPMKDHLKFAMSWWHTLCAPMSDPFGAGTMDRTYGKTDPMDIARAKVDAGFEFMEKLGFYACTVPTYLQYVLAVLLDSGDFERHINRVRRQKRDAAKTGR